MHTIRNTLFIGKVLLKYDSLESTNQQALKLLASKSKPSEGTVISATKQTAGRGQCGSSWESEAGKNLTVSLILFPNFLAVREQFLFNQAMALAVAETIRYFLPKEKVQVKWPNDIYVNQRKVAGILVQNAVRANRIQHTVFGVGINVNQPFFGAHLPKATSVLLEGGTDINLDDLLAKLCERVEQRYLQLRRKDFGNIQKTYLNQLYRFEEEAVYELSETGETFTGKITGLAPDGKLLLTHSGGESAFDLKEIRFL